MVFVACVVNQLCVMSSILRCRHFTNLIYLVSGDRRRTNFPVREAHNAHDSFAVSAMKERDVHGCGPFTIRLFPIMHEQCFPSNILFECSQPLQPRAHYIAYFPTEAFL